MSIEARFSLAWPAFTLDVDVQLAARGVTALFGPSGSGKTTLLRCIAGLERVNGARLIINGERWQDDDYFMPVHRRALGYVFQEASLFPHLTVQGNLDFGAKRSSTPLPPRGGGVGERGHFDDPTLSPTLSHQGRGSRRVSNRSHVIELLGIGHLLERKPERLSGGERQRVAIARALLTAPQLLLMDEPLAALDYERKQEILPYLERLRDELDIPIVYVSHAIDEVSRLADHLVLLDKGKVTASGPLPEITARLDLPLALNQDATVVIDTTVGAHDAEYHLTRLDFAGGCVHAGLHRGPRELPIGHKARISIQARDVSIALSAVHDSSILNRLPTVIEAFADARDAAQLLVRLDAGGTPILARISRKSRDQLGLHIGQQVWAQIKTVALVE